MNIEPEKKISQEFLLLCRTLDRLGFQYDTGWDEDGYQCLKTNPIVPMNIVLYPEIQMFRLVGLHPRKVDRSYQERMPALINYINQRLLSGCFLYLVDSHEVVYRRSLDFQECTLSGKGFETLIGDACRDISQWGAILEATMDGEGVIDSHGAWSPGDE